MSLCATGLASLIGKPRPQKLLDSLKMLREQVHEAIRLKRYFYRTEESYVYWVPRYILFHNKQRPEDMSVYYRQLSLDKMERIDTFVNRLFIAAAN